jgi:hypothetical protein
MRIWSLNPGYLDAKGITALWREGLLALSVLRGNTTGYVRHPQLDRFRKQKNPVQSMRSYLWSVYLEARSRGYDFDVLKVRGRRAAPSMTVTTGQLRFELEHLRDKLRARSRAKLSEIEGIAMPDAHPLFRPVHGGIEEWERTSRQSPADRRLPGLATEAVPRTPRARRFGGSDPAAKSRRSARRRPRGAEAPPRPETRRPAGR